MFRLIRFDDWLHPVFEDDEGNTFVDVDGELYTMTPDWEEPAFPTGIKTPEIEKGPIGWRVKL